MGSSSHTSKIKRGKDAVALDIIAYGFCGIIALVCLVPFIMIVSGSFSSESAIIQNGFSLLPQDFSLEAYKTVFKDPMVVFRAYGTTIGLTIVGTVLGLLLQTMTAYVLSRKEFEWRNQFSFFFYFTTLFSGGLVPYYVLMTQTLNLRDSYLALLLPLLFSVYNLLIMKSYIVGLPDSLIEAAKIDGCGEFRILFRIVMPLIKPALATVGLFIALAYWNDWYNAMLYIKDTNKYPLELHIIFMKEVLYEKEHKKTGICITCIRNGSRHAGRMRFRQRKGKHGRQQKQLRSFRHIGRQPECRHFGACRSDDVSDRRPYPGF